MSKGIYRQAGFCPACLRLSGKMSEKKGGSLRSNASRQRNGSKGMDWMQSGILFYDHTAAHSVQKRANISRRCQTGSRLGRSRIQVSLGRNMLLFANAGLIYAAARPQKKLIYNDLFVIGCQSQIGMQGTAKHAFKLLGFFPDFKQFVVCQRFDTFCKRLFVNKGKT